MRPSDDRMEIDVTVETTTSISTRWRRSTPRATPSGCARTSKHIELNGRYANFGTATLRRPEFHPATRSSRTPTTIIGGGFGGLLAGGRLREQGIEDLCIIEKGADFGGTVLEPLSGRGLGDVESHVSTCRCWRRPATSRRKNIPRAQRFTQHCYRSWRAVRSLSRGGVPDSSSPDRAGTRIAPGLGRHHQSRRRDLGALRILGLAASSPSRRCPASSASRAMKAMPSTPAAGTTAIPAATRPAADRLADKTPGHHRHRGDGIQAVPHLRIGRPSLRRPAHPLVGRHPRQPADRPAMGRKSEARLAARADAQLHHHHVRRVISR